MTAPQPPKPIFVAPKGLPNQHNVRVVVYGTVMPHLGNIRYQQVPTLCLMCANVLLPIEYISNAIPKCLDKQPWPVESGTCAAYVKSIEE